MCSDFLAEKISRAAAFGTDCGLSRSSEETSAKDRVAVVDLADHQCARTNVSKAQQGICITYTRRAVKIHGERHYIEQIYNAVKVNYLVTVRYYEIMLNVFFNTVIRRDISVENVIVR